jgi:3-oxoacyl-[acyl-carrier-protein] synthase II
VLESEAHATRRKAATLLAEVGGHGMTCDAYHITRPHPEAIGSIGAMRQAIERSGISPDAIDFVNAHGTGTKHNDAAESKVMKDIFGDRKVPISSMKSMLGHCMGAASALEAIGCIMTLERGVYPPRSGAHDVVLNNSLAFGGYNSVTCLARPYKLPEPPPFSRRAA